MHKKPTEPFGYIAFGKDGTVRKHVEVLPDLKPELEVAVGRRFADGLAKITKRKYGVTPCPENDHDFWISTNDGKFMVQATEIVSRDYLRRIDPEDYLVGQHSFAETVQRAPEEIYGVDQAAKQDVLLARIKGKLGKYYSKPREPLWLLIWTVCWDYCAFYVETGKPKVARGVVAAREYLTVNGAGPFEEIWFLQLNLRPHRIWPADAPEIIPV